jgi:hypothetical protein
MISLHFIPLFPVGRVLVPRGEGIRVESDYLHTRRAIREECCERGWSISRQSIQLGRCVTAVNPPVEVVVVPGGQLYGVWTSVSKEVSV